MFVEAIRNRIKDYNYLTELYAQRQDLCHEEMNSAIRSVVISITVLMIVYLILFVLAIYYSFKIAAKNGWPIYMPILLILAMLLPTYGGIFTIFIVAYGMTVSSICDVPADMQRALK